MCRRVRERSPRATRSVGVTRTSPRFEEGPGFNPEQLVAAVHAACFSKALASILAEAGSPPESVHANASIAESRVLSGTWPSWLAYLHAYFDQRLAGGLRADVELFPDGCAGTSGAVQSDRLIDEVGDLHVPSSGHFVALEMSQDRRPVDLVGAGEFQDGRSGEIASD
jgi:hypothetical protein